MCVILDADNYSNFKNIDNVDMEPIRKWLDNRNGKIVYSNEGKNRKEWKKARMDKWFLERNRAAQLKLSPRGLKEKENELKGKVRSNDEHIIALALVAKVRVLVSKDSKLIADFKEHVSQGKVYKTKEHRHLLTKDTCP